MFRGMFYPNKVSSELFRRGYRPSDLPDRETFSLLCRGLYASGCSAEWAASLISRSLEGDEEATDELRRKAGALGMIALGGRR